MAQPRLSTFVTSFLAIAAAIFVSALIARANWYGPAFPTAPQNDLVAPLHTDAAGEAKAGGLRINSPTPYALFVFGAAGSTDCQSAGTHAGCVGIGTNNPTERLDVVGNLNITNGTIKTGMVPFGGTGVEGMGTDGQLLTTNGVNAVNWTDDDKYAWMNIQEVDVRPSPVNNPGTCIASLPSCPSGWSEYTGTPTTFTGSCSLPSGLGATTQWWYGNSIRTCYKAYP